MAKALYFKGQDVSEPGEVVAAADLAVELAAASTGTMTFVALAVLLEFSIHNR